MDVISIKHFEKLNQRTCTSTRVQKRHRHVPFYATLIPGFGILNALWNTALRFQRFVFDVFDIVFCHVPFCIEGITVS